MTVRDSVSDAEVARVLAGVRSSGPVPPDRSLVQRMDALEVANDVRTRRARLKKDLRAGRTTIQDVLLEPPEWCATAKLMDVLLATPKYGRVKVNKLLRTVGVSPSKTVGGLSQRQRTEIVSMIRR